MSYIGGREEREQKMQGARAGTIETAGPGSREYVRMGSGEEWGRGSAQILTFTLHGSVLFAGGRRERGSGCGKRKRKLKYGEGEEEMAVEVNMH